MVKLLNRFWKREKPRPHLDGNQVNQIQRFQGGELPWYKHYLYRLKSKVATMGINSEFEKDRASYYEELRRIANVPEDKMDVPLPLGITEAMEKQLLLMKDARLNYAWVQSHKTNFEKKGQLFEWKKLNATAQENIAMFGRSTQNFVSKLAGGETMQDYVATLRK